jgi:hypothetical protein
LIRSSALNSVYVDTEEYKEALPGCVMRLYCFQIYNVYGSGGFHFKIGEWSSSGFQTAVHKIIILGLGVFADLPVRITALLIFLQDLLFCVHPLSRSARQMFVMSVDKLLHV